jgi:hypothetical protein
MVSLILSSRRALRLAASVGMFFAFALLLAPSSGNRHRSPEDLPPAAVYRSYQTVRSPFVAGCTAMLQNWGGGEIYWYGCPTNACGDSYNNPCQGHQGALRVWCECLDGTAVLCRAEVAFKDDGSVSAWNCVKFDCAGACTKTVPPAPVEPGVPALFYGCDC